MLVTNNLLLRLARTGSTVEYSSVRLSVRRPERDRNTLNYWHMSSYAAATSLQRLSILNVIAPAASHNALSVVCWLRTLCCVKNGTRMYRFHLLPVFFDHCASLQSTPRACHKLQVLQPEDRRISGILSGSAFVRSCGKVTHVLAKWLFARLIPLAPCRSPASVPWFGRVNVKCDDLIDVFVFHK